ncbi:hypothetical protein EON67_09930, partial [archaeon]
PEDLATDEEYAALLEEVREEFGKYGTVTAMNIPRSGPHAGRVFAQFATPSDASNVSAHIAGRVFAGRTVTVEPASADSLRA